MIRAPNKIRSMAEKASRESADIVSSPDDAVLRSDLAGIIVAWNKGAKNLLGYSAKEIIGQPITTIIPEHLHEESLQFLRDIAAGQSLPRYETVRKRKNGRLIDISLTVSPVRDSFGKIVGASKIALNADTVASAFTESSRSTHFLPSSTLPRSPQLAAFRQRAIG